MTTQQQAEEAVKKAGDLYEQGMFPFDVYDGMRIGLTNGYYALVVEAFNQAGEKILERQRPRFIHLSDQLSALWRDIKPAIRAFVAQADEFTESQWMDQPEIVREQYETWKAFLAKQDGERQA